jgi:oligoendopeptidase F
MSSRLGDGTILGMTKLDTSKTNWDLSPLLATDDDPKIKEYRNAITKASKAFASKWRDRTDYLEDPKLLKETLDEYEAWGRENGNGIEYYYFHLRASLDSVSPEIKAGEGQAREFLIDIENQIQFFSLNIAKIPAEKQSVILGYPDLQTYKHWLEQVFANAKYTLCEAEEKIINLKSTSAHSLWVQMTSEFISKSERQTLGTDGKKRKVTFEELSSLISDADKPVRDAAAGQLNDILAANLDTAVAEMNAILVNHKVDSDLRGYDRPDRSRLISDDVDAEVVDALLVAVAGMNQVAHRFYGLKAKLLGLPHLDYHERNVPYGNADMEYSFEDGCKLVQEVLSSVDSECDEIFTDFLNTGKIDVYPVKGKRGGAFCAGQQINHPTFIMLNHTNKLRDVSTIAHEVGHGIHNELSRKHQNGLTMDYPMATAEVASTFFEGLVMERLYDEADEETELALRVSKLGDSVSTIFRQSSFYRFEKEMHLAHIDKGYLSAEDIGSIFQKHMADYMGPVVRQSTGSQNWWVYVPHFRYFFYVYSYASGDLISAALRNRVQQDNTFIDKVKGFMAAGSSKSPKSIFADMGIDITDKSFWQEGLQQIKDDLESTEKLAKKLGKI